MSQEVWAQGRSEPLPASRSRGARGLWALIKSSGTLPRPAGTAHSPLQGAVRAGAWWLDGSQNQGPTLGEEQTGRHLKAQGGRGATPTKPLSQSPVWPQTQMGLAETAGCGRPAPGRPAHVQLLCQTPISRAGAGAWTRTWGRRSFLSCLQHGHGHPVTWWQSCPPQEACVRPTQAGMGGPSSSAVEDGRGTFQGQRAGGPDPCHPPRPPKVGLLLTPGAAGEAQRSSPEEDAPSVANTLQRGWSLGSRNFVPVERQSCGRDEIIQMKWQSREL